MNPCFFYVYWDEIVKYIYIYFITITKVWSCLFFSFNYKVITR